MQRFEISWNLDSIGKVVEMCFNNFNNCRNNRLFRLAPEHINLSQRFRLV